MKKIVYKERLITTLITLKWPVNSSIKSDKISAQWDDLIYTTEIHKNDVIVLTLKAWSV